MNGYLDTDGCPDDGPKGVEIKKDQIVISDKILFDTGQGPSSWSATRFWTPWSPCWGTTPRSPFALKGHRLARIKQPQAAQRAPGESVAPTSPGKGLTKSA